MLTFPANVNAPTTITLHGAGTHSQVCNYLGDPNNSPSASNSLPAVVTLQQPIFNWMPQNSVTLGGPLTATQLDATVAAPGVSGPVPGTLVYTPPLGTLVNMLGTETLSVQFTPIDQVDIASASDAVSLQVTPATPGISFTAPTAIYGDDETLTATVTGVLGLAPTGAVMLQLTGSQSQSMQLVSSSTETNTYTYSYDAGVLGAGAHSVGVYIANDKNYEGASEMTSFNVAQAATSVTLTSSSTSVGVGAPVVLTATATSTATPPIPNGDQITFFDGNTNLGVGMTQSGKVTLPTSFASPGTFSLTAVYGGDGNFMKSTSPAILEVVATADYTITVQPPSLTIVQGQAATAIFTLTSVGGYDQPITFSCSGLPANTTCTFNPSTVTPTAAGATTLLTIQTNVEQGALSLPKKPGSPDGRGGLETLASGGIVGSLLFLIGFKSRRRELKRWQQRVLQEMLLITLLAGWVGLVSCAHSPETPVGEEKITITATGGSGNSTDVHTVSLSVNITQ